MTETQLRLFPAFKTLPIYDERDERVHTLARGDGKSSAVRECSGVQEVEECLKDPRLVPLGGVRTGLNGTQVVVVYFGELA